jgi:hypothetical protein
MTYLYIEMIHYVNEAQPDVKWMQKYVIHALETNYSCTTNAVAPLSVRRRHDSYSHNL